jgi:hypothetical protein
VLHIIKSEVRILIKVDVRRGGHSTHDRLRTYLHARYKMREYHSHTQCDPLRLFDHFRCDEKGDGLQGDTTHCKSSDVFTSMQPYSGLRCYHT